MPTKKILLRGISRRPSEHMSADGGLAESIGFETDMQELAVNVQAQDVTASLGLATNVQGADVVFIHKTNDYCNYIAKTGTSVGWLKSTGYVSFYTFQDSEVFQDIKSIGNTLMILTTKRVEYVLYKAGAYTDLGDEIPEPRVNVYCKAVALPGGTKHYGDYSWSLSVSGNASNYRVEGTPCGDYIAAGNYGPLSHNQAEDTVSYSGRVSESIVREVINWAFERCVAGLEADIKHQGDDHHFSFPRFLRYAVRLYDGSYVRHSAPIMLKHPQDGYPGDQFTAGVKFYYHDEFTYALEVKGNKAFMPYYVDFDIDASNKPVFEDWSDIITGVDLFLSDEIRPHSLKVGAITDETYEELSQSTYTYKRTSVMHSHTVTDEEHNDRILSKSIFYRIKEIPINEYVGDYSFSTLDLSDIYGDTLLVKPQLPDDTQRTNNKIVPLGIKVYNERLLAIGANIKQYHGYYALPSLVGRNSGNAYTLTLRYYIKKSSGEENVVQRQYSMLGTNLIGNWLYYPDPRCYKCMVAMGSDAEMFDMKEHPYLNGAYCMTAFANQTLIGQGESVTYPPSTLPDTELRENTLFQYGESNMFLPEQERSFPYGRLIDLAVITKPLSTAQFGYSSLYIFTDQGLFAVATENDGSLGKVDAVSQDVALPGTVCQLDQAVAFIAKKGVMLLTGSDLRCISEHMHGKHYKLEQIIFDLLRSEAYVSEWGELASIAYEDEPFMTYMEDARIVYDYIGRRLLFFSVAEHPQPYIYTYMIDTESWHKIVLPEDYSFKHTLNSFPDTYVSSTIYIHNTLDPLHHETRILSFSNARSQSATRRKGMIVTRPLDLDEDDVRKVLDRIMVRGLYDSTHVKMIIMASMDGQSWQRLTSWRGGSYKLFKVVLLCDLTETERISYLEAEFETRYDGRLR